MKKKFSLIMLIFSLFIFSNCENMAMLEETPIREATQGFMTDAAHIESVLLSSYYQIKRYHCFSRYYHTTIEALADYATSIGSYQVVGQYQGADPTITSRTNDVWACFYRAIRFANMIIAYAPDATEASPMEIQELIAEARFIRAFCYLHLTQLWGAVPMSTEEELSNSEETNLPRIPQTEILAFAASDLEIAATDLPDAQPIIGRPQKITAKAVLAEVYMHMEDWEKARDNALDVINSGKYRLVEVSQSNDFYNLYHPKLVNTTEEIFYLKYREGSEYGSAFGSMLHRGTQYYNATAFSGIHSTFDNPFYANWSDDDLRKDFNIYVVNVSGQNLIYNKKFIEIDAIGDTGGSDMPLYRLADILLFYAEAACRANNGPTADAMEKLNMVHRRAYGKRSDVADLSVDFKLNDYNTEEAFMALILTERGYETCYEGKRYNDLKRTGKLAEYVMDKKGLVVGEGGYWFAIPSQEFLYNKGMDPNRDQNPGY
ncbi:RagB/SusD family nutrient uptake outer membrane protein [Sphingobacterium phlebotomi]|uniref:RagB/SusD family nutrient uptake outer membrane protein n=1 Tax=Sphingobacterium phlebotomi TaxID=2605433 RepID=A0A5D4HD14_9SPHI|nr:RagB/SusD family nutrient uptake outer membrane protein [Sphingobacterium phlebotomi]TYR38464.1 RagB/SusD family nutrient uptake outer membrane protein [Sphingobacterium phlebotomi]